MPGQGMPRAGFAQPLNIAARRPRGSNRGAPLAPLCTTGRWMLMTVKSMCSSDRADYGDEGNLRRLPCGGGTDRA